MLKTRIIPCLDVKNGRVVKGINFLDLVDAGDPVEQAKIYSEVGADEICFLDISASIEKRKTMINIVAKMGKGSPSLVLNTHIDTVGTGDLENWNHNPFEAVIDGNNIFGLGAANCKCSGAVHLYRRIVRDLDRCGNYNS